MLRTCSIGFPVQPSEGRSNSEAQSGYQLVAREPRDKSAAMSRDARSSSTCSRAPRLVSALTSRAAAASLRVFHCAHASVWPPAAAAAIRRDLGC
eukprot:26723-Pleurochrysis_carterae.AAC.1